MNGARTEAWLAAAQARFSAVLRKPLVVRLGVLDTDPAGYAPEAVADILPSRRSKAEERLSIYQRQYWVRLLRTLQEQYPMTTRLLGAWFFNQHAIAFFQAHPPRSHDLGDVVDGFDTFLAETLEPDSEGSAKRPPRLSLIEASRLDAAYRRVFMAPEQPKFALPISTERDLLACSLSLSPTCALVEEHWPLARLRLQTMHAQSDKAITLPRPWLAPQHGLVHRTPRGVSYRPLGPVEARLLALLERETVGRALGLLEAECSPEARASLPALAQKLLATGVRLGFFSHVRND